MHPAKNWVAGCRYGYLSGARCRLCIWPSLCHCYLLSLASVKSRLVLPIWYRLTWVVPEKGPLNGRVCVTGALYHDGICGGCRQPSQESPCQACGLSHRARHSCDINDKCHNNNHWCFVPRRYLCWRMSSTESAKPMSSMRSTSSSTTCRSCLRSRVPRSRKSMIRPGVPTTTSTPARTLASVCCVHAVQHTYQRKLGLLNWCVN